MTKSHPQVTGKILPTPSGNPPNKLADAELHFTGGVLDGLKLIGSGSGNCGQVAGT